MWNLENELNAQQRAAVTAPDGPILVVAAAGTGKTRTLTYRMAWLVKERGIMPHNILLLTFTNRAAREMLTRAEQLIGEGDVEPWGGTFHHVATRILRRQAELLGYSTRFTILDQEDSHRLIKACMAELGYKASKPAGKKQLLAAPGETDALAALGEKRIPKPEVLSSVYGLAASREAPVMDIAEARFDGQHVDLDAVLKIHELYTRRKTEQDAMDFDDLLSNALKLLRSFPETAAYYQNLFQYILVDEYQDTNRIQAEFVNLLAAGSRNLMVVGDDFQSIYSWRGADVRNMLDFRRTYPDAREILLEENYRSSPGILDVANCVVDGASGGDQIRKHLRATRPEEGKPRLARLSNGSHQARFVAEQIRQCMACGVAASEIAVLYRSHFLSMEMQLEFTRERLPFTVLSGTRFFEQRHIKDVCTFPLLLANPRDGLAFTRLLEMLPGVGEKKARAVWQKIGARADLHAVEGRKLISEALPKPAAPIWDSLWRRLFDAVEREEDLWQRPDVMIEAFQKAFYSDFAEVVFENPRERLQDIAELVTYAARFTDLAAFLSEMALMTNLEADQDRHAALSDDTVRLTTIHQAKGLEWKVVFLVWLTEGSFPAAKSMEEAQSDAEERRLFYVAVTRAKDILYLCVPRTRTSRTGEITLCEDSRYVREIPDELLTEIAAFQSQFPTNNRFRSPRSRYF